MTDYFNDQYTSIGQSTVDKLQSTFPSIPDKPIEVPERQRSLSRENIVQETVLEGPNKTFRSTDDSGKTNIIIGYKAGAF